MSTKSSIRVLIRQVLILIAICCLASSYLTTSAQSAAAVQEECVGGLTLEDLLRSDDTTFCTETPSDLCTPTPTTPTTWGRIKSLFGFLLRVGDGRASAHDLQTGAGSAIEHFHRPLAGERDFTAEEKDCINEQVEEDYPDATRTGEPTISYDCHGYTFDHSGSWINDDQVAQILADDYAQVNGPKQVGDIIVYRDADGNIIHTGKVTAVDGAGNATEVESKWGSAGQYKHAPGESPYGGSTSYYR